MIRQKEIQSSNGGREQKYLPKSKKKTRSRHVSFQFDCRIKRIIARFFLFNLEIYPLSLLRFVMWTYLLSLASTSSTASHAKRASGEVTPNFLLSSKASAIKAEESTFPSTAEREDDTPRVTPKAEEDPGATNASTEAADNANAMDAIVNFIFLIWFFLLLLLLAVVLDKWGGLLCRFLFYDSNSRGTVFCFFFPFANLFFVLLVGNALFDGWELPREEKILTKHRRKKKTRESDGCVFRVAEGGNK